MNILVFLIPISLVLGGLGLFAFVWTIKAQQYDDPEGQAARILLDDTNDTLRPRQRTGNSKITKRVGRPC